MMSLGLGGKFCAITSYPVPSRSSAMNPRLLELDGTTELEDTDEGTKV